MVAPLAMLGLTLAGNIVGNLVNAAQKPAAVDPAIKKTAQDFETMFLENTLERMSAGDGDEADSAPGAAGAGGIYRSMLAKEHAAAITRAGGLGIADGVYAQMLKMQEAGDGRGR